MVNVLFVCLGNICRSPMAEAIFKSLVIERNYSQSIHTDSAGTAGYHIKKEPDRRTLEVLHKHAISTDHRGRKISLADLDAFDHIVVMDEANFEDVHGLFHENKHRPPTADKLFLIRDYDPEVRGVQEVPDPYYESTAAFEEVYTILKRSCEGLLNHLVELHQLEPDKEEE